MGVMSVSYLTVDGEILSETRNGVESDYIPDPLGSTAALTNSSQTITDTFLWWPYGELRSHIGSSVTPFCYGGTLGYYADNSSREYVRANNLRTGLTRWQCLDGLWPIVLPFTYVHDRPLTSTDPSGLSDYSDCMKDAMNHMLTQREACILCQQQVNNLTKGQAEKKCRGVPRKRGGPRPPLIVPKKGGGHYSDPPPVVSWLIGVCGSFMPTGADVMANAPGSGKDLLCIVTLKRLGDSWDQYCGNDDSSPGRGRWPGTTDSYWDNYCSYLDYAISEWKAFCQ